MENKYLGNVIKSFRKALKMTQKDVSQKTGFSQNTISNHENGNRSVGINELSKYLNALTVNDFRFSQSTFFEIAEDLKKKGSSVILNNIKLFLKIYEYVTYARNNDSDIYYYHDDLDREAIKIFNIILGTKYNEDNITYEFILDIYKQILSIEINKSDPKLVEDNRNLALINMTKFNKEFLNFGFNEPKTHNEIINAIDKTFDLEEQSLELGKLLKDIPNYTYDYLKGRPMYKTYTEKFPQEIREAREYLKSLLKED